MEPSTRRPPRPAPAAGAPGAVEDPYVRRKVWDLARVDLGLYKSQQMNRRLQALLQRSGHSAWPPFFAGLEKDPAALAAFRGYLTINVTRFFRDPAKWAQLAADVLPTLPGARRGLRIWSAGCSNGAEAYTLAMLLQEQGAAARHRILATDIDEDCLARARAGGPYLPEDVDGLEARWRERYLEYCGGAYWVRRAALPPVRFAHHDLLNDPFETELDLIVCRNVVIYFTEEAKRRLYQRFAEALRPGGVLFVGGTETVPALPGAPLAAAGVSFYRKEPSGSPKGGDAPSKR